MADGVLITGLRPVRIQVDPEFAPQIFVSSTRQRERLVDQAGGDFDLDPPIVDRKAGLFVYKDLKAGKRQGAGGVSDSNARLPDTLRWRRQGNTSCETAGSRRPQPNYTLRIRCGAERHVRVPGRARRYE